MSPLTRSLLALTGLVAPLGSAHGQNISGEQALLNRSQPTYRVVVVDDASSSPAIDGERALLGRSAGGAPTGASLAVRSESESSIITGEQALLGRRAASAQRRLTVAW